MSKIQNPKSKIQNYDCFNIITVNETQIVRPSEDSSITLSCDVEKPCFTIRNGYLESVQKCYKIKFPNAIEVKSFDVFNIDFRLPKTLKSKSYEYQIIDTPENVQASAFVRGTYKCAKLTDDNITITPSMSCGWLNFDIEFELREDLGDVCEIEYSLCFNRSKLRSLTRSCECEEVRSIESITYGCEPCVKMTVPPAAMILQFTIPSDSFIVDLSSVSVLILGADDTVTIDWGDNTIIEYSMGDTIDHTYATMGDYEVRISGIASTFNWDSFPNPDILTDIIRFGKLNLTKLNFASNAINGNYTATDIPQNTITDMSVMFARASNIAPDVSNWDVSNVTDMQLMFAITEKANPDVSNWDVSNVTNMKRMFFNTEIANPNTENWTMTNISSNGINSMFSSAGGFNVNENSNINKFLIRLDTTSGVTDYTNNPLGIGMTEHAEFPDTTSTIASLTGKMIISFGTAYTP